MSSELKQIMIVDDSPQDIQMVLEFLRDKYSVIAATSGKDAMELLEDTFPDVILMDVTMPVMDGYQACESILKQHENADIIFLSANTETDEIMKGYEVGGIDYVTKPFAPDILISKIELAIRAREEKNRLAQDFKMATDTAMMAMSSSGELSQIISFMRESFSAETLESLSEVIMNTMAGYQLSSCLQLKAKYKTLNTSHNGEVSPLEEELLTRMQGHEQRLLTLGKRMFVNFEGVTLLVKNLPEDEEVVGRMRDYLMILAEGGAAKLRAIDVQQELIAGRKSSVGKLVEQSKAALDNLHQSQQEHQRIGVGILDNTVSELEASFMTLGLTEEQEESLIAIVNKGAEAMLSHTESGQQLEDELGNIVEQLTALGN